MSKEGTILHADADSFYASVEQRDDPSLRGRPVIVGAGVVLAASYEAKAYGVRTPMGQVQALRLCPEAIVVTPRMETYSAASKAMFGVFNETTPFVEGLSIDEAFLEVGGLWRISGTPTEIAVRLRREVLEIVGLPITGEWPGPSSSPRWRAAWRSRTVSWSSRSTASWSSSTRYRSSACGGWDR